jgi:hypothetical protein
MSRLTDVTTHNECIILNSATELGISYDVKLVQPLKSTTTTRHRIRIVTDVKLVHNKAGSYPIPATELELLLKLN